MRLVGGVIGSLAGTYDNYMIFIAQGKILTRSDTPNPYINDTPHEFFERFLEFFFVQIKLLKFVIHSIQ